MLNKSISSALASGQTCFEAGECRESHHVHGETVANEIRCLEICQETTGEIILQTKLLQPQQSKAGPYSVALSLMFQAWIIFQK